MDTSGEDHDESKDSDNDFDEEGEPKSRFPLTNFLFGNVNRQWELEDFEGNEEERQAINQLDRCHVTELAETVSHVITADASEVTPIDPSSKECDDTKVASKSEDDVIEAVDFYDFTEAIDIEDDNIDLAMLASTTFDTKKAGDDEDDYDADDSQSVNQKSNSQPEVTSCEISKEKSSSEEGNPVIKPELLGTVDLSAISDTETMPPPLSIPPSKSATQTGNEGEESVSKIVKSEAASQEPQAFSSTGMVIDNQETNKPANVSNQFVASEPAVISVTNLSDQSPGPISSGSLNTPLGNMMPEEYMGVNVRSLFPEYDPRKTPRWSKIFKPVYPVSLYKAASQHTPEELEAMDIPLWSDDRPHIFYNKLDLGRIPTKDEILPDDGVLLSCVEDSALNPARRHQSADSKNDPDGVNKEQDKFLKTPTWRNGPAELWYEMLGLPKTADLSQLYLPNLPPLAPSSTRLLPSKTPPVKESNGEGSWPLPSDASSSDSVEREEHEENEARRTENKLDHKGNSAPDESPLSRISAEALLPLNQMTWEDDVVWDVQACQNKILASHKANAAYAGWIPSIQYRTMALFQDAHANEYPGILSARSLGTHTERADPATWHSIFPVENPYLASGDWQNDIIWDVRCPPPPALLTLDRNDEALLLDTPHEIQHHVTSGDAGTGMGGLRSGRMGFGMMCGKRGLEPGKAKVGKDSSKAKMILNKHGLLKDDDDMDDFGDDEEEEAHLSPQKKDPFNLSNDEYYYPRLISSMTKTSYAIGGGGSAGQAGSVAPIQHSTPAMELRAPFFPLHLGPHRLRTFHRPPLKRYGRGAMATYSIPQPVINLAKNIRKKNKQREDERAACGGGEIFFMRTPSDLTAMDGEIILAEYSEEFPSLMMQVGMSTRVINYYKRPSSKEAVGQTAPPQLPYGELVYIHQSPFLGQIKPGQCLQALENNMYRGLVYPHRTLSSEFLVIRNRQGFYLRRVHTIFTVGQCFPLMEVPGPNSKRANNFVRDSLQVFIYRLFWKSEDEPRRIKMEDVRKAFPSHSESSVRKRLKLCADFKRTGADASWWVLRPDCRLPAEEELRAMVSPEDCCAYYSMLAAEQRLKDAGWGEKYIFVPPGDQDEDEEKEKEGQVKMVDEVRAAPWNTTHAYLSAMRGKCNLELHGAADPTGCGEAFSLAKSSNKPSSGTATRDMVVASSNQAEGGLLGGLGEGKRMVTGTDADLRKLHLRDARAILRKCGVPEMEIKKLKRWEIIDLVRTMSNQKAKQGDEEDMAKFARGSRLSTAEQQERYREECQRIFDLQNRMLASEEVLSTDDASTSEADEGDSEGEAGGQDLELMLANKMTSGQLRARREEEERRQLQRKINAGESLFGNTSKQRRKITQSGKLERPTDSVAGSGGGGKGSRVLKITRTFVTEDGKRYTRTEVVPWGPVAEIYLHLKENQSRDFIQNYVGSDEHVKEERRREKRRLQDKQRRIRKLQTQSSRSGGSRRDGGHSISRYSRERPGREKDSYSGGGSMAADKKRKLKPLTPALIKMRCGACGGTGHMRTNKECPFYGNPDAVADRPPTTTGRPRKEYQKRKGALMAGAGGRTVSELLAESNAASMAAGRDGDDTLDDMPFEDHDLTKVEGTKLKMSTGVLRYLEEKNKNDLKMKIPRRMLSDLALQQEQQDKQEKLAFAKARKLKAKLSLSRVEQQRGDYTSTKNKGNRRRIDPKVALNHIFEGIYKGIQLIPGYKSFLYPVKEKDFPTYRQTITSPMDLSTIRQNIHDNKYSTRQEFLDDIQLIRTNSIKFNGEFSEYTETATRIISYLMEEFCSKERKLMRLERLVNPLLDEDDLVGFNFVLGQIVEVLYRVENSRPFHQPVDKKRYKDYYVRIQHPMDLKTMETSVKANKYRTREDFLHDVDLIVANCVTYNGQASPLTTIASKLAQVAREKIQENQATLEECEATIRSRYEEDFSVTGMDTDSVAEPSIVADLQSQTDDANPPGSDPITPGPLRPSEASRSSFEINALEDTTIASQREDTMDVDDEDIDVETSQDRFGGMEEGDEDDEEFKNKTPVSQGGAGGSKNTRFYTNDDDDDDNFDDDDGELARKRLRFSDEVDNRRKLDGDLRLSESEGEEENAEREEEEDSVRSSPRHVAFDEETSSPISGYKHDGMEVDKDLVLTDSEDEDRGEEAFVDVDETSRPPEGVNLSGDLALSDDEDVSFSSDTNAQQGVKFYIGDEKDPSDSFADHF